MKWLRPVAGLALLLAVLLFAYAQFSASRWQHKVDALERERTELLEYVKRLCASRRVAQVSVIDQTRDDQGRTLTRLQWQEIRADGLLAPPVDVEVVGAMVYFEAMIIKFDHRHVGEGDAERGWSAAVFRRIFGDQQAPESAAPLARPGSTFVELNDPGEDGRRQWGRFWEMVDDPNLAARLGVRSAQCEAAAAPFREGQVWEVALDAAGGLNLKKLQENGAQTAASDKAGSTLLTQYRATTHETEPQP